MGRRLVGTLGLVVALACPAATVAAAPAKPVKLTGGSAALAFDVTFGLKLVKFGVTPGAIAPSVQDGLTVTAPLRAGSTVRADGSKAIIKTAGGVSQVGDTFDIQLQQLRFIVRGRKVKLSALTEINGVLTDRFNFATGVAAKARRVKSGYAVDDLKLRLNDIGAATLNSQLRTSEFAVGELIAVATIAAKR